MCGQVESENAGGKPILRVTMISKACLVGAYQSKLQEIAAHDDIDLTVVVPRHWREGRRVLKLERVHAAGYRLVVAPIAFSGCFHLHFYPTLRSILSRSRPTLCHVDEEPYNLATYLAVRAARARGARTLFFTWQNLLRSYPPPFRWMEGYVYHNVDGAIAGSQGAAQVLRGKGYNGPLAVIPQFGVDPKVFRPASRPHQEGAFCIGYAGRLVQEKGLSTLVAALAMLPGPWRLVLCGAGPMKEELAKRFSALGLAQRVTHNNQVPSRDMPRHLAMMDVLVLPSLTRPNWKEQFGRVLIEAMSCQVPVIGSNSGEIPQVIDDAGLVFSEGDAEALRDLLAMLRANPALGRELGAKGRKRVLANYTQAQIAAKTVAFYRTICQQSLMATKEE